MLMEEVMSAAYEGDWKRAKGIFESDREVMEEATSTARSLEILNAAAFLGHEEFFNEMLKMIRRPEILAADLDLEGGTLLHNVAAVGNMNLAKALVEKYPHLTQIPNLSGHTPLLLAIARGIDKDFAWYLTLVTTDQDPGRPFSGPYASDLIFVFMAAGYHDILLFLLQRHPNMAETISSGRTVFHNRLLLSLLASMPCEFRSTTKLRWLGWCIYPFPGVQKIRDTKLRHKCAIKLVTIAYERNRSLRQWQSRFPDIMETLNIAASSGVIEILEIFFKYCKYPINALARESLFIATLRQRQDKVFNFLLSRCPGFRSDMLVIDLAGTTTLHMAAELRSCPKIRSIAGAAFQMQKELQWFKGIEKLAHPLNKEMTEGGADTPWDLFKKEHRDMRKEGEKWMKETSNSCMLVATLIATVVFAAAFTVPGGNNQDNGTPIFLQKDTFLLFAIFDALALFLSVNSLWMFLSIPTAHFAEEDFLKALPNRLIFGFTSLFLAIVSTVTAFGAALSLVLGHRQNEISFLVILMAFVSVATFALLQLPLFFDMVRSTYCSTLLVSN